MTYTVPREYRLVSFRLILAHETTKANGSLLLMQLQSNRPSLSIFIHTCFYRIYLYSKHIKNSRRFRPPPCFVSITVCAVVCRGRWENAVLRKTYSSDDDVLNVHQKSSGGDKVTPAWLNPRAKMRCRFLIEFSRTRHTVYMYRGECSRKSICEHTLFASQ